MTCRMAVRNQRLAPAALVLALGCFLSHSSVDCSDVFPQHSTKISGDLFEWLKSHGATTDLEIGEVDKQGLRGTLATRDFTEGEVIAIIPNKAAIDVGSYTLPGGELAVRLLRMQLSDPKWKASFEPYWKSLPKKGTLYSKENWRTDPEHLALFQDEYLASYAEVNGNWTQGVYAGTNDLEAERMFPDLVAKKLPGANDITYDDFAYAASLAATYTFVFPNSEGHYMRVMVPLLDLVNHKGTDANAAVTKNSETGDYYLTANRDIKKGEEVTHTYNWDNERNDYSVINYFFIQKPQQPRLCAVDLPNGNLDGGFGEHDDHYLPHEKSAILNMVEQLETRLKEFPTSEEEDAKLLADNNSKLDWMERRIVDFRKERKRALKYTIARLKERAKTAYSLLGTPVSYKEEL